MVPEFQLNTLYDQDEMIDLCPELENKVQLYWHHWIQQPCHLESVTDHIVKYSKLILK